MLLVTLSCKRSWNWPNEGVPRFGKIHGVHSIGTCLGKELCLTQEVGGIPIMPRVFLPEPDANHNGCAITLKKSMRGLLWIASIPMIPKSGTLIWSTGRPYFLPRKRQSTLRRWPLPLRWQCHGGPVGQARRPCISHECHPWRGMAGGSTGLGWMLDVCDNGRWHRWPLVWGSDPLTLMKLLEFLFVP